MTLRQAVRAPFIGAIRLYQRILSPMKPVSTCRFVPTCSQYAIEAIEKRGVVVGLALGFFRILRCNPLCKPGYDPVPLPCCHDHKGELNPSPRES